MREYRTSGNRATAHIQLKRGEWGSPALVANTKCCVKRVKIPAPHHDLNDWTRDGATAKDLLGAMVKAEVLREPEVSKREPRIRFFAPSELRDYRPDKDIVLTGA